MVILHELLIIVDIDKIQQKSIMKFTELDRRIHDIP